MSLSTTAVSHPSNIEGSKVLITVCAMIASLMAVLDISIVNVALNDIRASFGVQLDQIAWVSTGYMMANVIVIPLTGWFQKRFGLKNYFIFSVLLFTAASFLCGTAWNLLSLTLFRILQGAGGGAIIPTASTILISRYPREQQAMAQSFIGLGAMTGPLLGPSIGGYLIDILSWHWIFLINIPLGLLVAFLASRVMKMKNFVPDTTPLDVKGLSLLVCGLGSLQYVLEEGSKHDWFQDASIVVLSMVCFVCLVTVVFQQLESQRPMIDFRVFFNKNYLLATIINFFLGTCLFGASFLFSLFCGTILNYSPLDIGLLFLKGCCIQIFLMPLVGKLAPKVDGRILIVLGMLFVAYSIYLNSLLTQQSSSSALIFILFLRSIGLTGIFIPLSLISLNKMEPARVGNAVGLFNLTRELGGSIGLAWMSTQLINHMKIYYQYLRPHLPLGNVHVQQQINTMKMLFFGRGADAGSLALLNLQNRVHLQATIKAFGYSFSNLSMVFFGAVFIVLFLNKINRDEAKSLDTSAFH